MDPARFTTQAMGELIQISQAPREFAFVPHPLPADWELALELEPLLGDAREALARLDGIGRLLPNPQLLITPLQGREALTSSRLEGTYATPEEMLLFRLDPTQPTSRNDPRNEWLEVANCVEAMRVGYEAMRRESPIHLRLIRQLHEVLLRGVRGDDKQPGRFRSHQVAVGSDRRFVPPPRDRLDACLNSLEQRLNAPERVGQRQALAWAYLLHYQFETIHPFEDGNGRIGRVLLALTTWKWAGLAMPWLYMSPYFERYKKEYTDHLFRVSAEGDINGWLTFCFRGTVEQAKDAANRCEILLQLRKQYAEKLKSPRSLQIVDQLLVNPMVQIPALAASLDVSYHTARKDVEALMDAGIVEQLPERDVKTYRATEIIRVAFASHVGVGDEPSIAQAGD